MKKWFLLVSFTLLHLNAWICPASYSAASESDESLVEFYTRLVAEASQPGSPLAPLLGAYLAKLHHFENLEKKNAGLGATAGAARAAYAATRTDCDRDCSCACHCGTTCH